MKKEEFELITNFDKLPASMPMRKKVILGITGWSPATFYRRIKTGDFPEGNKVLGNNFPTWTVGTIRQALRDDLTRNETTKHMSSSDLKLQHNQNISETEKTLIYPAKFDEEEIKICNTLLANFEPNTAQQILDEIQGNISAKSIRRSPISLLFNLCQRAKDGQFTPALGLSVKKKRDEVESLLKPKPPSKKTTTDPAIIQKRLKDVRSTLSNKKTK